MRRASPGCEGFDRRGFCSDGFPAGDADRKGGATKDADRKVGATKDAAG